MGRTIAGRTCQSTAYSHVIMNGSYVISSIEVQVELPWMRTQLNRVNLAFALVPNPCLYHVVGEDMAFAQKRVVGFERRGSRFERTWYLPYVTGFFRRQVVDVPVERIARIGPVFDAVEPGHQHGCKSEVRI